MAKRTLIIDGQVFQSAAWNRGMGKYSLNLLRALFNQQSDYYNSVVIIFTKNLPISKEVKAVLKEVLPNNVHWVSLELKVPDLYGLSNLPTLQRYNEQLISRFVAEQGAESCDFLILSLFIEQVCSVFPDNSRKILLFYDLIPLQYFEHYSKRSDYKSYLARFKTVLEADIILTISQTIADDLAINLGIDSKVLCNINGASIERQHQKPCLPKVSLPSKFLLMPTGEEFRKNNFRAVQGFEEFRKHQTEKFALVLTSFFTEKTKKALLEISPEIVFTNNVPEAELLWLYQHCQAVLFVPEYEGLGLPILEAVEAKKPIVCSDLAVFNEMSPSAFYYADQFSALSIAEALTRAVKKQVWSTKATEYPNVKRRYTWSNTAKTVIKRLQETATLSVQDQIQKPRLAILAPNPAKYSAIGKVVMQLHPELSRHFAIDYYLEDGREEPLEGFSRPSYLPYFAPTRKASEFNAKRYSEYDAVIYHIGNSEFHLETIKNALYLPGFAIVHDARVRDLFGVLIRYGYVTDARLQAELHLDRLLETSRTECLTSVLNAQQGVVVHSQYAQSAIEKILLEPTPVARLNLPVSFPARVKKKNDKQKFSIAFAGIIHAVKGIDAIESIIQSPDFADANIHIFGISVVKDEVLHRLRSYPNVTLQTSLTDFEFQNILSQMDVTINYRPQYRGETSLTVLEAMRFGVVPFVRRIGWFAELPDDCSVKVDSPNELIAELRRLRNDPKTLKQMATKARKFIAQEFSYKTYANELAKFIASSQRSSSGLNAQVAQSLRARVSQADLQEILVNYSPSNQ